MARPISLGRADVTLGVGEPTDYRAQPDTPLRVAILGDFRGRGAAVESLADRRPIRVDRDNFDEVMGRLGPTADVPLGGGESSLTLRFAELDDFHPDRLYEKLEVFRTLRELRAELGDPSTFEHAASRMQAGPTKPASQPPAPEDPAKLLDQMLGGTGDVAPTRAPSPKSDVEAYLHEIVAPYLTPGIDRARQAQLQAAVDDAVSGQMRALLHHPRFQSVESVWRSLFFLVRRLDTGRELQLYLVDVTKQELAANLGDDEVRDTGLWRMLFERGPASQDGLPWGVLVGLYPFGPEAQDVGLLFRLAGLAQRANAPFLAEASSRLLGSPSLAQASHPRDWQPLAGDDAENWRALRQMPESAYLGLVLPRMLLRQPYGKDGSSVEGFDFEEMPPGSPHEAYLWGSPAAAWAYLLAEAFGRKGWEMQPGDVRDVTGLPLHVYREDDEARVKPCAEVVLSDRAVEAVLEAGLMPLLSLPGQDAVRLGRARSVSASSAPLAGAWG